MKSKRTLTKREAQIFRLITAGKTNLQIAYQLALSVKTIEAHKHNILIKIGVDRAKDLRRYKTKNFAGSTLSRRKQNSKRKKA